MFGHFQEAHVALVLRIAFLLSLLALVPRNLSAEAHREPEKQINQELKRRTCVARVFPNESSCLRSHRRYLRRLGNRKNLPQQSLLIPAYDLMPAEITERNLRGRRNDIEEYQQNSFHRHPTY